MWTFVVCSLYEYRSGGGKGPGCGFKFAGSSSRTRSHIFSGSAALKTIPSRMLNYGNYHGKYMIIHTNYARSHRQLYDYGVFILPPKYKYEYEYEYLCLVRVQYSYEYSTGGGRPGGWGPSVYCTRTSTRTRTHRLGTFV